MRQREGDIMPSELISVVMPVYQPNKKYLCQSVKSILEQNYPHFELIIIEDPSENLGQEIVKEFNNSKIRYILNPDRTGFAHQINQGINLAKGKYIARMDADDVAEKDRLNLQIKLLLKNPDISLIGSSLKIIDENDKIIGVRKYPQTTEEIVKLMRIKNAIAHPTVMFKKEVLKVSLYTSEFDTLADYDLWAKMILNNKNFYNIQQPLLRYRIHPNATKHYLLKKQLRDTIKIKKKYFRFKKGWNMFCELRYWAEHVLLILPAILVYRLFLKINIEK